MTQPVEGARFTMEKPVIDFLLVADRAEAISGKLYLMGGAWDRLTINNFEQPAFFSLAVGVLVPWSATDDEHRLQLFVETEDGKPLEPRMDIGLQMGRPPGAIKGQPFRALIAANGAWVLPGPGTYRIVATLQGGDRRTTVFHAMAA